MHALPQDVINQINLALEQRNAGRDYYEFFIPGSIKLALATWPKAKLDAHSIDNGYMFRYRFGFEPTPIVRQQIIEIQNKYHYTDEEVRWLKRSRHFAISRNSLKIETSPLMPAVGWLQIIMLSLFCISMVLKIEFSQAPEWNRGLGTLSLMGIWFAGSWILYKLYLYPWKTLKQSGAITAIRSAVKSN